MRKTRQKTGSKNVINYQKQIKGKAIKKGITKQNRDSPTQDEKSK